MTVCPVPNCPEITEAGRCAAHKVTTSGTPGYGTSAWQRTAKRVRDRAATCECALDHCLHDGPCAREPRYADPVIERKDGGTDAPDNLQALCAPCHGIKTHRERRRRESRR